MIVITRTRGDGTYGRSLKALSGVIAGLAMLLVLAFGAGTASADTPPAISGIQPPIVGDTLTANPGTFTVTNDSRSYQWGHAGILGCSAISGATNLTYVVASGDAGQGICVTETAYLVGLLVGQQTSAPTQAVITVPSNTSPPSISGTAQQGSTLIANPGTWTYSPSFTYFWQSCGSSGCSQVGGSGPTYTLTAGDVGATIRVTITGTNRAGTGTAGPVSTGPVTPIAPVLAAAPVIFPGGPVVKGQTLLVTDGTWSNSPTSFTYQWYRCGFGCTPIAGATAKTYTLTASDVNFTIEAQVTAMNAGGSSAPVTSGQTTVVTAPPPPASSVPPTIAGSPQVGATLTAGNGSFTNNPYQFSYQWLACNGSGTNCAPIGGATGLTYGVTGANLGSKIEVQVTAGNAAGTATAVSAQTGPVAADPTSTTLLAVPSTPVTGQTVTMVATVAATFGSTPPEGSVAFQNRGVPVAGCAAVTVATFSPSVNITCQNAFSAASGPENLTAVFTPNAGSTVAGSSSQPLVLSVGRGLTTVALDVSNPTIRTGSSATYTATVTPSQAGSFAPSGTVEFIDNARVIASCANQPLVGGQPAHCTIRYAKTAKHTVTALYRGDGNFVGSSSQVVKATIRKLPKNVVGTLGSKMQWKFLYTPTYTRVLGMVIHSARAGTRIMVDCDGHRCPAKATFVSTVSTAHCSKTAVACRRPRSVSLSGRLRSQRLPVGSVLRVRLARPHLIGKEYFFSVRSGRAPRIKILCVAPGAKRAGVGC